MLRKQNKNGSLSNVFEIKQNYLRSSPPIGTFEVGHS